MNTAQEVETYLVKRKHWDTDPGRYRHLVKNFSKESFGVLTFMLIPLKVFASSCLFVWSRPLAILNGTAIKDVSATSGYSVYIVTSTT